MEMGLFPKPASLFLLIFCVATSKYGQANISPSTINSWVSKLGSELWTFGDVWTRRQEMIQSFTDAKVESREGLKLVQDIAREIRNMMELKISAVKRIMDTAENSAEAAPAEGSINPEYPYYNAKQLNVGKGNGTEVVLVPDLHFNNISVNTSFSAVHVPTNVYDRSPEVLHGIKWSANLDDIFVSNYRQDPTLSWQYFGSSTGFMRQFPAMEWKQEPVDLYDCRTRSWYIEAATSPKDILILVDNSGSMMGQRKEIARHVVSNILDTLGNNDFVNILSFVKDTEEVVPCFKDRLVQANLANIRELKMGMERMKMASNIANFTIALTKAFELLQAYREEKLGAACNQAIMLITDGVPYNFKEIFEEYNWRDLPKMPVRVFTYLIGREIADVREVKWMACANRGYYVHLSTMADVRERVLQYVPVMARPMVLYKKEHPVIWTPVYADVEDPKMTDWLWEMKERAEQKERSISFRRDRSNFHSKEEHDRRSSLKKHVQDYNDQVSPYRMMTSVSMPVYDRRENANLTERVLINEAFWVLKTRETKVANLLGVAGTDVPNSDIQKLMVQHLLGVNAYAFIVTNNGYVLIHPDLRPVFQAILKPSYNSIDVTEVELLDDDLPPRVFNKSFLILREKLINQTNGSAKFCVKYHYDRMKRASRNVRHYYYNAIGGTPFELIVALPDVYGLNRVEAQVEIKRLHSEGKNPLDYFHGKNWKIHPDWFYCKCHTGKPYNTSTPEEELKYFLERSAQQGWKWPLRRSSSPPEHQCDRKLFLSLVYDAKVTEWFSTNISTASAEEKGKELKQRFGLTLVFMATRSGLTRWQDISLNSENEEESHELHFSEIHNRAIDEIWYKRAVEQYLVEPLSFVYSVPFDSGDDNDTLVTASHAIFHSDGSREAPAAVVGFQFHHSALHAMFLSIVSACEEHSVCETCASDSYDCYVLDNNGYIVISENREHTGMFFGEVKGGIMKALIDDNHYSKIQIYDYQAVCFRGGVSEPSNSSKTYTPMHYLSWLVNWIFGHILWILAQTNLQWMASLAYSVTSDDGEMYSENYEENHEQAMPDQNMKPGERPFAKVMINRTRPQPCDMEVTLYQLNHNVNSPFPGSNNCRPYDSQHIPYSNLIMIVVNTLCQVEDQKISATPVEVMYNESLSCYKAQYITLPRRRPKECINNHLKEQDIKLCGNGIQEQPSHVLTSITFIIITYFWLHP